MNNRKIDPGTLQADIRSCAGKYAMNCTLTCVHENRTAFREEFGAPADSSRIVLDGASGMLLGLSILMLYGDGVLSPSDPVGRYISSRELLLPPELTIELLLCRRSGLPDPVRERLLPCLHSDPDFCRLSCDDQRNSERLEFLKVRGYRQQLGIMSTCRPEVRAGFAPSSLDEALLCEIISRVTGGSPDEFLQARIFGPLGISAQTDVTAPDSSFFPDLYTVSQEEAEALLLALCRRELLSADGWQLAADGAGGSGCLPFCRRHGILCGEAGASGHTAEFILDGRGTGFLLTAPQPLSFARDCGVYRRFDLDVIDCMNAMKIYPSHTRMERLSSRNLAGVLAISVEPEQSDFAASPAAAAAQAAASKHHDVFAVTDSGVPVGMLTLCCEPLTGTGRLENLMIDRRFQRRGFGRIAVRWAVEYLRRKQMAQILLAVHRDNSAAVNLYTDAGFLLAEVHDDAFIFRLDL